uniref:Uncharacterized protein n=1 Tax=Arundo donax TaxID=35708 RepID=A0A0A9F8L7_ARUDO
MAVHRKPQSRVFFFPQHLKMFTSVRFHVQMINCKRVIHM